MRNGLAWAVVGVAGLTAGPAAAQQVGSIGGGGGVTGGGGMGGGGSSGGTTLAQTGTMQLATIQALPQVTAPTGTGSGGVLSQSNFLSGYYTNPYSGGLISNNRSGGATGAASGGAFGTALFPTSTGTGGGAIGFAGNQVTGSGSQRVLGAAGLGSVGGRGATGLGGAGAGTANTSAVVVPLPVQFSFPTIPQFPAAPVAAPQLRADLSGMIARSTGALSNPAGVQVLTEGNTVVLRGPVAGPDEARLVEGMVRLTPGVRAVRNELTFPAPAAPRP